MLYASLRSRLPHDYSRLASQVAQRLANQEAPIHESITHAKILGSLWELPVYAQKALATRIQQEVPITVTETCIEACNGKAPLCPQLMEALTSAAANYRSHPNIRAKALKCLESLGEQPQGKAHQIISSSKNLAISLLKRIIP